MLNPHAEPASVFRHCPRCGAPGLAPHGGYGFSCRACGFLFFLNVAAAAAAILGDAEGRVLLARRAHDPGRGKLDVPGGFVDPGETAEQAIRRELREELSVEIDELAYFATLSNVYEYGGLNYRTLDVYFTGRPRDPQGLRPADDIEACEWVQPATVDAAAVAFDSVRRALALYAERHADR
jgi:mutator protein MutT